jgi:hypothetical protein
MNSNNNYKPDINFDKFVQYKDFPFNYGYPKYLCIPSQFKKFNDKIIIEIASYYKINIKIIELIDNNLTTHILNSRNQITKCINNLSNNRFFGFYINPETKIRNFDKEMLNDIKNLLNINILYQIDFYHLNDEYSFFVDFILLFYRHKCARLIELVNTNINKIISINNKVNKIINFVSFLKEKKNQKIVDDLVFRRVDEYNQNKIILQFYDEVKDLEIEQNEVINNIFTKHDLRVVTFNLFGNRYKKFEYNKNNYLSFIYKLLNINKSQFNLIKKEVETIDSIISKIGNARIIYDIIYKINEIELEINYLNYNVKLYVHRQRIINDYSKYLKTLHFNMIEKIGPTLTNEVFHNLIIAKKYKQDVIRFLYTIIHTNSEDFITL